MYLIKNLMNTALIMINKIISIITGKMYKTFVM